MSNYNNDYGRDPGAYGDQPMNYQYGDPGSSNDMSGSGVPGQPATPRMLRSISGSLRNSRNEIVQDPAAASPSPGPVGEFPQYTNPQGYGSHSRNPSFQQSQQQQQHPQTFDPNAMTPQTPMHRRNPSTNAPMTPHSRQPSGQMRQPPAQAQHPQQGVPTTLNPKVLNQQMAAMAQGNELLPPASISTPNDSNGASTLNSKVSVKKQSPNPHSPPPHGHQPSTPQNHQPSTPQNHGKLRHGHDQPNQQQPFHRKSIGDWEFVKTIGAGSMGKVKLAQHNSTAEICAVKIVPRAAKLYQRAHQDDPPPQNQQEANQRQKEYEKEVARDKRTTREGVLGRLLFHPYVCRLYEIVPMTNHYYMLFEYVEGGQMLDYIVAHGSLKEKHARKFARGIASALDYCHRNNVVHRDLKIENIMINQKADIKIIDFGLSNLYSPKTLLKTYCGSLYFAAPELLCAKPYVGPEVDIWSFGIVLYVLVCGKVPFDDQSVNVLHEKIKKANVEYPSFLSKECVSLLTRMIQVDPTKRATLHEVMSHPWMSKGYDYPISTHIPKRYPLTLPLNAEVINTIATFDLGNFQSLKDELNSVVGSLEYQMSSENWYKIIEQGREYATASNAHILPDPTGGFHPLVSIYYLVEEMIKRKRAKEGAVKAQLEQVEMKKKQALIDQQQLQQEQAQIRQRMPQLDNPTDEYSQATTPQPRMSTPVQSTPQQDSSAHRVPLPTPEINQPEQVHTPAISFPEQAHTSLSPNKSESPAKFNNVQGQIPDQQPQSPVPDNVDGSGKAINSLLRKFSGKRSTGKGNLSPQRTPDSTESRQSPSKNDPMVRRGISLKVTAKEKLESKGSRINVVDKVSTPEQQVQPKTQRPIPKDSYKRSHNRSQSINATNNNKNHGFVPVEYLPPLPNIDSQTNQIVPNNQVMTSASGRKLHPTARSKSVGGHIRKDSGRNRAQTATSGGQRPPLPDSLAAQNSDEMVDKSDVGAYDGFFDDILLDDEDENYTEIPQLTEDEIIDQFNNAPTNTMPSIEYPKTLFLKGFFSVQTTSTKPLPVIRYNIINVLTRLGVKFQEVKGGFVCSHTPSLQIPTEAYDDENSLEDNAGLEQDFEPLEGSKSPEHSQKSGGTEEEKLYGDAFKSTSSSFEQKLKAPEIDAPAGTGGGHSRQASYSSRGPSRQPSLHLNTNMTTPKGHKHSSSIGSMGSGSSSAGGHRRKFSLGNSLLGSHKRKGSQSHLAMPPNTPAAARINRLLYNDGYNDEDFEEDDFKQFTEDDSVDSVGNLMVGGGSDMLMSSKLEHNAKQKTKGKRSPLNFEIHVVKFPLVGLYGVQFKKLLGNTWTYKTLAGQILNELKL